MSSTLTYDFTPRPSDFAPDGIAQTNTTTETGARKPGFFLRMMEAIGRTYYVPTANGEGVYILPF